MAHSVATQAIDISKMDPHTAVLEFDSSWRPDGTQEVQCSSLSSSQPPLAANQAAGQHQRGAVRVLDRNLHSTMPIEFYAFAPLDASMRVTNAIPLGCALLLPVETVNSV
jgi:hypothetical protein